MYMSEGILSRFFSLSFTFNLIESIVSCISMTPKLLTVCFYFTRPYPLTPIFSLFSIIVFSSDVVNFFSVLLEVELRIV